MRTRLIAGAVALAVLSGGCGSVDGRAQVVDDSTPAGRTVNGMTAFGHDLLTAMSEDTGEQKNLVVSPLSVAAAFGMARAGAGGETAAQIDRTFGFPAADVHAGLHALLEPIVTQDDPPSATGSDVHAPVVAIGNGLFVQQGMRVKQDYAHVLREQYGAAAQPVDFRTRSAAGVINDWVSKRTAGRIDKLFDDLPDSTRLVLANAVYFDATWRGRFDGSDTEPAQFRGPAGDLQVPTMHTVSEMRYAKGRGWQAVELSYDQSELALWVLVPKGSKDPLDLLTPKTLKKVGDELEDTRVDLALPRWDFASDVELRSVLGRLGLTAPFSDGAELGGIADGEQLAIQQAVHRANITVDENGTQAAAATGIGGNEPTSVGRKRDAEVVRADHPFAYAIVHKASRALLFEGRVADPSAR